MLTSTPRKQSSRAVRLAAALWMTLQMGCPLWAATESLVVAESRAGAEPVPYVLNAQSPSPKYVLILFPGGHGVVNPQMQDGRLLYGMKGNFLLRARTFFVDEEFATVSTNATQIEERIQTLIDDLHQRFPGARIYLVGTSRGTFDTMTLADYLATRIEGEIHTSSLARIASFDARRYANRHLVVHHRLDGCFATPFGSAESSHKRFGNDFIAMEGGVSVGDPCEARAYHGYNGIEGETVAAIKRWIKQAD